MIFILPNLNLLGETIMFDIFDIIATALFTIAVMGAPKFFRITSSNYEERDGIRGAMDLTFACIWAVSLLVSLYHLGSVFVEWLNH